MAKYKIIPSSRNIVQSPISIGHKAEKGVEAIEFDVTAWVETYGSGTLTVIMRRWGDAIPYPIALEIDENNKATWVLSDIDTAKAGMAYAQLSYIVGDEVVKKSDIYTFRVMDSLTGEGEPPEAYESWLEHLTHLAAEAMAEVLDIEGVATDKTLTVDGGIADAKATGEALAEKVDAADYSELSARVGANTIAIAEKADRSTTYTKTEVDALIDEVEVETDTTLEIAGAPADAAGTGRQIGLLKADLGAQTGVISLIKDHYIITSDTPISLVPQPSTVGRMCAVVDCTAGDKFVINAYSNSTQAVTWCFIDSANNAISMAEPQVAITDLELTAPANAVKLIINDMNDGMSYKVGNNLASKIDGAGGLSNDAKIALLNCFDNVAWDNKIGRNYYNILKEALNLGLTSISAVFNQGNSVITTTDSLDDLRAMLTVTGSDGREIKAYTLSGSLNNAISTITAKVNELTTTFSVNVSSLPSGYTEKSYVQADGSQRIPSGIYEPDMVGAWIRQKQCTTELLDKAGHILSSTNYVVPFQRYFPTSDLGRVSYNRFGEQTTTYSKAGNYWNVNENVIIESFKDGNKIFLNGEHIASLPSGSTMSSSNQLYFFRPGTNTNTVYAFRGRLYYMKLFNASGIKLHDFVPCKNSSNVAGLYDLVTGEFHAPDIGTLLTD